MTESLERRIMQSLLDESGAIIWAKDLQGRYIYANEHWFARHDFNARDHLGKTDLELMPEMLIRRFIEADESIKKTRTTKIYDYEDPFAQDGLIFRTKKFPIFDDAGNLIAVGGMQFDISEARSVSDKLEIHQDHQRLIREISLSGLLVLEAIGDVDDPGLDFLISDANKYAGEMFEMRQENMIGERLNDLFPGHLPAGLIDVYRRVLRTGENETFDVQYDYDGLSLAFRANAGRTQQGIVVAFTGITDLVEAQAHLKQLNEQIAMDRAQYINVYRSAPALLFSTGEERVVIDGSDRFFEHFGYTRDEVIGSSLSKLLTEESNQHAMDVVWPQFLLDGYCADQPYQFVAKSGQIREVELSSVVDQFSASIGRPSYIAVLIDVTERNIAKTELVRKNLELQKVNKSLESFAYIASHDLQEPLRKIRQFSEIFVEDYEDKVDEDGRYFLQVISNSAQRMSKLIADLLGYSRASNSELVFQSVDLGALIEDVCVELELKIAEAQASILYDDLPVVEGDRPRLEQLLLNLISNALKYRHPDRVPIIRIHACEAAPTRCIKVSDNGIGFDQQYADQIFQPFKRLHPAHEYEGSGIGLALCRTICSRHGWSIKADGRPGEGATISICRGAEHDMV